MLIQFLSCFFVLGFGEIYSKIRDWNVLDDVSDRCILTVSEMSYKLTAKEIVINPSHRVNPSLDAPQNITIKLLRSVKIICWNCMVKGFILYFRLHPNINNYKDIMIQSYI